MNKVKKLAVMLLSLVCVAAFATTSAFATDYSNAKAQIKAYLNGNGISVDAAVDSLTNAQIDEIKANQTQLQSIVSGAVASVKSSPGTAQDVVNSAVAQAAALVPSIPVSVVPTVTGDKVSFTVSVNGTSVPVAASVTVPTSSSSSSDSDNGTATTGTATAANPVVASGSAVIKATGDSSAVVMVMAALAVAGVLGMAVRKSSTLDVA